MSIFMLIINYSQINRIFRKYDFSSYIYKKTNKNLFQIIIFFIMHLIFLLFNINLP